MSKLRNGFTLVEVLVVIAIVAILAALAIPAVQAARESSRQMQCAGNLKQIGLALHGYHVALGAFPPGNINYNAGRCPGGEEPTVSYSTQHGNWMIAILPYLEQEALFERYDVRYKNESPENRFVRETPLSTYLCPSDRTGEILAVPATGPAAKAGAKYARGSYRAVSGRSDDAMNYLDSEMMFAYRRESRGPIHAIYVAPGWGFRAETTADIRDGLSSTLLVGESTSAGSSRFCTFWAYSYAYYSMSGATAQARTLWGDYDRCTACGDPNNLAPCKRGWGSRHKGIVNFVFCDGSVHPLSIEIDLALFGNLATIDGSEIAKVPE
jgi:prepilin-type N-terminal cleavage/methylation domain-containing protein/prepilin-type processing-associated H-X9-DG protein